MAADPVAGRRSDLETLADGTWDVVIVGGGIVGSGALLDAVSRGMRAALIEQDDIASGTSSRSSRLIHGGLRYLEQFRFGLVREALAERSRLLDLAPHLVRLEPLLFPIYGIPFASKAFYDAGLTLYDILGARHDGGWHRRLSKRRHPRARPDPADRRACAAGCCTTTGSRTTPATRSRWLAPRSPPAARRSPGSARRAFAPGPTAGSIEAVLARDVLTGADLEIRTTAVVDATGVWEANADHPFGGGSLRILPSRGAHLVVPRARIPNTVGLTIRVPGKIVFLVPWPEHWLIGTTDAPYEGPTENPAAGGWEVTHLLDTVNATMDVDLRREDVVGTYAGLRPLIAPSDGSTVKASREHRVSKEANGVVRIGGGKYTTYRVMAADVIDAVLGTRRRASARPSRTAEHRLVGAADRDQLDRLAADLGAGRGPRGGLARGGRTPGRPPRHRGAGRARPRALARPRPAARRRPAVPRGRGAVGGPARARAVGRRRPGAADPALAGAARSRRGGRATRRRAARRGPGLGRGAARARGRGLSRVGAAPVLGRPARGSGRRHPPDVPHETAESRG